MVSENIVTSIGVIVFGESGSVDEASIELDWPLHSHQVLQARKLVFEAKGPVEKFQLRK